MSNEFTLCNRCSANNMPGRAACWQCGSKLPLAVGMDGRHVAVDTSTTSSVNFAEIEALLNQASTVDVEGDTQKFQEQQRELAEKALRAANPDAVVPPTNLTLKARLMRLVHRQAPQSQP
jgi:hypothetical protein